MKYTKILLNFLIIFVLSSCDKENEFHYDYPFMGFWTEPVYQDELVILSRAGNLSADDYGFGIMEDGIFHEKKNAGFCGTPPITYHIYEGSWEPEDDSTLLVHSESWMGDMTFRLRIKSNSTDRLVVSYIYPETEY